MKQLDSFRWYTKARKAMSKTNKNDEFMSVEYPNNMANNFHIASPTFMRTFFVNNRDQRLPQPQQLEFEEQRFSTRTRLRPGGPTGQTREPRYQSASASGKRTLNTRRPGSAMSNFEEVRMRTMAPIKRPERPHMGNDLDLEYPDHFESYTSTLLQGRGGFQQPSTPLAKHRNSPGNLSSPRIQMYRTRVVYNDARPSSAGFLNHEAAV